jgi:hypothetical protein
MNRRSITRADLEAFQRHSDQIRGRVQEMQRAANQLREMLDEIRARLDAIRMGYIASTRGGDERAPNRLKQMPESRIKQRERRSRS